MSFLSLQFVCLSSCVDGGRHASGTYITATHADPLNTLSCLNSCTSLHTTCTATILCTHRQPCLSVYPIVLTGSILYPCTHNGSCACLNFPSSQLFFWSQTLEFVLSIGGALLFCGFIIFDTHIIMHKLSPEEYILASINLYLDFINLFIYILRILQAARKD